MDRALHVLDVVELIVDNLTRKSDLAHLARVNNKFWRQCVRRIWRDLKSLDPLLVFFFHGSAVGTHDTDITSWPIPSLLDIERCAVHAGFLRSLSFITSDYGPSLYTGPLGAATLQYLSLFRPRVDLFPNLQSLFVSTRSDPELYWTRILLSSSLESLDISLHSALAGCPTWLPSFVQHLPDRTPQLKSLTLYGREFNSQDVQSRLGDAIKQLFHLTAFHADFRLTHPDIVTALAAAEHLESASLNLTTRVVFGDQSVTPLTKLRYLHLTGYAQYCGELLERVQLPVVQRLEFDLVDLDEERSLLRSITQASASLQQLEINLPYLKEPEQAVVQPAENIPVYACKSLVRLCKVSASLSEEEDEDEPDHISILWTELDISQLAQSLSRLRYLNLRAGRLRRTRPRMSPHSFFHLATHCRLLETLIVAIDMHGFIPPESLPPPAPDMTNLTLEGFSLVSSTEPIGDYIIALWPNARLHEDEYGLRYGDVQGFCAVFNARRLVTSRVAS